MEHVFVDTVALIALINTRDSLHTDAKDLFIGLRKNRTRFITSEFVLLELANAFSGMGFRERAAAFISGLQTSSDVQIIPASTELFSSGLELYRSRPDKEWSLVDRVSFGIMENKAIRTAFTGDHHFEQAGFAALLLQRDR